MTESFITEQTAANIHHKIFWDDPEATQELMRLVDTFLWIVTQYEENDRLRITGGELAELVTEWRKHNG